MLILAIETSCDETSVALVQASGSLKKPHFKILSNVVSSQVKLHAPYGGVVPILAVREHTKNLIPVLNEATKEFPNWQEKIDFLAVTEGPGLMPALLVGVSFARALAYAIQKPILGVSHLEGHIYSTWLKSSGKKYQNFLPKFPALSLIVSGGHTLLAFLKNYAHYQILGETRDDACGEAFDKVARILGLGYPGGPLIEKLARRGNPQYFHLPRPMLEAKNYDFSFAGLKTAVLYLWQSLDKNEKEIHRADLAAAFQEAIAATLIAKTLRAARDFRVKTIMISGGVSANTYLRKRFQKESGGFALAFPPRSLATDNAAMISLAGYFHWRLGRRDGWQKIKADANLRIPS